MIKIQIKSVLILVVMDHALTVINVAEKADARVLILVVMDHALTA